MSQLEAAVAVIIALVGAVGVHLGYKRSLRVNDDAQENVATSNVYGGYAGLVRDIQNDRARLQVRLDAMDKELEECKAARTVWQKERGNGSPA